MKIYIDGEFHDEETASVSVLDHGLLYGDGIFEGIRIYNGRVFRLDEHILRLYDSAKCLGLSIPMTTEEMIQATVDSVNENGLTDGYIRLLVTRGRGSLGLSPKTCPKPSVIIIAADISLYPEEAYETGLKLITCSTRRPTPASLSPQVKSLNYLNNVMAKMEAQLAGCDEGLMLNEQGYVAECTGDNVFVIKRGEVFTPPVSDGSLDGITREAAIEILADLGITCSERHLTRYDMYTADECFLTGTAAECIPAVELDGRPIGDGKPGAISQRAIARFREVVSTTGTPLV